MIQTKKDAIDLIYKSYNLAAKSANGRLCKIQRQARELLHAVGSPDKNKKIILIAGSKGKGSTAAFISTLLQALGFRTGLFTSPHYNSFNERIQVNSIPIPDGDFIRLANRIASGVEPIIERLQPHEYLGPIAINLAIALLYFAEKNVDYVILEAGKGGKYDDTNVVSNQWSVITPILNEHLAELGPTMPHLIAHKIGIIKEKSFAFISKQQKNVETMMNKMLTHHRKIYRYEKEFSVLRSKMSQYGMVFDFKTKRALYKNNFVPLLGGFQCENIALAVQTCEEIIGDSIDQAIIQRWLQSLKNPGKCELLLDDPPVIADAAINKHSAKYLHEVVQQFMPGSAAAVVGLSSDKDYEGVIQTIAPFTKEIFISKPINGYRSFREYEIYQYASQRLPAQIVSSPSEALKIAIDQNRFDFILILGNHSFIAETKQWFESPMSSAYV